MPVRTVSAIAPAGGAVSGANSIAVYLVHPMQAIHGELSRRYAIRLKPIASSQSLPENWFVEN